MKEERKESGREGEGREGQRGGREGRSEEKRKGERRKGGGGRGEDGRKKSGGGNCTFCDSIEWLHSLEQFDHPQTHLDAAGSMVLPAVI